MNDTKLQYLPFFAINEFMRVDYRHRVITEVFAKIPDLPQERQKIINQLVKNYVSVPGFRNSTQAPLALKCKGVESAFEKRSEVVAQIITAWTELHQDLKEKVFELLESRDWQLLPIEAERAKLPGFLTTWRESDTFEQLHKVYFERFVTTTLTKEEEEGLKDDIGLMVVWLAGRLPYEYVASDKEEKQDGE